MMTRPSKLLLAAAVLSGATMASAEPLYSLIPLGAPVRDGSTPFAINNQTQIVGILSYTTSPPPQDAPFLWQNGTMAVLSGVSSPSTTSAYDINNIGQVVGSTSGQAYIWQNGIVSSLGPGVAYGLNDKGEVVGVSPSGPVLWRDGTATALGSVGGGNGIAWDINNNGHVVGQSWNGQFEEAFIWQNGLMTGLGDLNPDSLNPDGHPPQPGGAYRASAAWGINDHGWIVGGSIGTSGYNWEAVLWRDGGMERLGHLGPAGAVPYSLAKDVNNRGQVVGHTYGGGFLWDDGTMWALNGLLDTPWAGWVIRDARAINDLGQIVATACDASQTYCGGVLLTTIQRQVVTEPTTLLLLGAGLSGMMARRSLLRAFGGRV